MEVACVFFPKYALVSNDPSSSTDWWQLIIWPSTAAKKLEWSLKRIIREQFSRVTTSKEACWRRKQTQASPWIFFSLLDFILYTRFRFVSETFYKADWNVKGIKEWETESFTSKPSVQIRLGIVMNKKYLPLLFSVYAKWIGGSGSHPSNKCACHNWQLHCHSQQTEPRIKWSMGSRVTSPPLQARVEAHWQKAPSLLLHEQGCAMDEHKDISITDYQTSTFLRQLKKIVIKKKKIRWCLVSGWMVT